MMIRYKYIFVFMGTKFIINIGMYQLQSDEMGSDQWKSQVEESSTSSQQI